MLPEDGEPAYRIYIGRRPTNDGIPAVQMPQEVELDTDWAVSDRGLSESLCQHQVWRPQHFNCHASFPVSFATELHKEDTGNIYKLCYLSLPRHFGFLKLIRSYRTHA